MVKDATEQQKPGAGYRIETALIAVVIIFAAGSSLAELFENTANFLLTFSALLFLPGVILFPILHDRHHETYPAPTRRNAILINSVSTAIGSMLLILSFLLRWKA